MAKLMLLSILIVPIVLPARAARVKNPMLGLRKTLINMAIFNALYLFGLLFLYGRL